MSIKSEKLGPGLLTFGDVGSPLEWGRGVPEVAVKFALEKGDKRVVLSGDRSTSRDETYTLEGKVLQTYDRDSLILWAHENANAEVPFTFKPAAKGFSIKGTVVVRRIDIGGKVDDENDSDFNFEGVGMPTFVDDAGKPFTFSATNPPPTPPTNQA